MMDDGFYNQDCIASMKEFPDKHFDLAIVDPPYGISITARHIVKDGTVLVGGAAGHSAGCMVTGNYGKGRPPIDGGVVQIQAVAKSSKCHQNFIMRSMIAPHRTKNILGSWKEYRNTGLYGVGISFSVRLHV